ncbi:MAG: efflux RND transporter permease subunit [Endozoicomonas sp.]
MNWLTKKLFLETLLGRLLLGLFVLVGVLSYQSMVRENYPDLEIPMAMVITPWPGAAPEQVEKEITKPLEDEIRSVKGLKTFSSGSYNSYSMISVEFDADMPVAEAMQQLRAKIDKAESEFPANVGVEKPELEEMSVSDMPVISWVLHGDVDDMVLTDMAKRLENQFERIPTIKKVNLGGLREKSLHVRLSPDRLRALGISPLYVRDRLQAANVDMAWGEFEGSESILNLYMAGRFDNPEKVKMLPIMRLDDNRPVRLGEIAEVSLRLDREVSRTFFSMNGNSNTRGITLDVSKRPGEDTFAVIRATQELVNEITDGSGWPAGLELVRVTDDGELIEQAFGDISSSMMQAVVIVFFILMFLLSWREALIAGLGLPVTLLATLGVVAAMGYTFNSMVMIGMVLALGLLVDVFILVMEGMHEGLFVRREPFSRAAVQTVRTFALPALAGQMTTILAMAPMMMVGGIDGKFIRILPVTITITLLISLMVAFLICIPLSRYLLEKASAKHAGQQELLMDRISQRYRGQLAQWLQRSPLKSKRNAGFWVVGALAMFMLSMVVASILPSRMYTEADDRKIGVALELPPESTLNQAQRVADKVSSFLGEQPWVEKFIAYVGAKSPVTRGDINAALLPGEATNEVGFTLILVPKDERQKLSFDYLEPIRKGIEAAIADEAGVQLYLTHVGGNPEAADPIQIDLIGPDYQKLRNLSAQVRAKLSQQAGAVGIRDNLGAPLREVRFELQQEMLSFHGLNEMAVAQQVRLAMEEDEYGSFKVEGIEDDPKLRISTQWASREGRMGGPQHLAEMRLLQIITDDGRSVPFIDIADFAIVETPRVFVHKDGQRAVTVQSRAEGRTASEVVESFIPVLDQMKADWQEGYDYRIAGEMAKADESYADMGNAFLLAMVMIYILLTLMFNSLRQPLIILLVVPLAMTGTFFGYFLASIPMSFAGLIGVVSLAGIAVNNGIVMVETMNSHRRAGRSVIESAALGASDRLRPILSTSLTTILGLIPLAMSDPQWYPLCMAIIFGLLASTVVAMVVVPALYVLMTRELLES